MRMRWLLYPRLALTNLVKNRRLTLPYLLACAGTVLMFYTMDELSINRGLSKLRDAATVQAVLFLGVLVIGIFAAIVLYYTNGFLIKGRMKELGLYSVLGMEKRHISLVLLLETLFTGLVGVGVGLALGVLFGKLMFLLLLRLLGETAALPFQVSLEALGQTCLVFACIFALILLSNLRSVKKARPMELVQAAKAGEKEPKSSAITTVFGLLCLSGGYAIAILSKSPLDALLYFFVAVLLVIFGTHALFRTGSIALLKMLRANKRFYYRPAHFIAVSGMLYRMRKNAAGLANICILCTMVLVVVSATVSLYAGQEHALRLQHPRDVSVEIQGQAAESLEDADFYAMAQQLAAARGLALSEHAKTIAIRCYAEQRGSYFDFDGVSENVCRLYLLPLEEYVAMGGEDVALQEGEVLVFSTRSCGYGLDKVELLGGSFQVKEELAQFPIAERSDVSLETGAYLVFANRAQAELAMGGRQWEAYLYEGFNLLGEEEEKLAFSSEYCNLVNRKIDEEAEIDYAVASSIYLDGQRWQALHGGFLFLGLFLGTLFMMATVLIIYYKQVSEGLEDSARYQTMQKVGMSKREVRASIDKQIVWVFFLPLAAAVVHTMVAFPAISKMEALFFVNDMGLMLACTLATIAAFSLLYVAAYLLTARVYYRIVS